LLVAVAVVVMVLLLLVMVMVEEQVDLMLVAAAEIQIHQVVAEVVHLGLVELVVAVVLPVIRPAVHMDIRVVQEL
jgi:hypothetical protein